MMVVLRVASCLALFVGLHGTAAAQCSSKTCTDIPAIENVRALVSSACDCAGAESHGKYVKCAKQVVKSAISAGNLPGTCKKPVLKCEARSTCGKAKSKICCVTSPKGKVKALAVRGTKCPRQGQLCEHPMALADACTADGACTKRKGIRSFKSVQRVLQTSCALPTCHSTFYRQGGLVLESEDLSYKNLVNRPSVHPEATNLLRVAPGDPAGSFLIRKLRGQGPGDPMPQAGQELAEPIITMIEDWIARGAKSTAEECAAPSPGAESLCDDETSVGGDYKWEALPPLEPPAPHEGIQMHIPPRDVEPGTEWETCYAFRPGRDLVTTTAGSSVLSWTAVANAVGQTTGLPVIREQAYRMHPGSHHLLLYAYIGSDPDAWPQGYFPCSAANCINESDCPADAGSFTIPIGGTQVAGTRYQVVYPEGVGIPVLTETSVLIVNPHFTNPFQPAQNTYGEAWLNLYFYPPERFKAVLDGIFAINFADLFVEPYTTRTISRIWYPRGIVSGGSADAAVFNLFGHMHKRATEFQIDYVRGRLCSVNKRACGRDSDCPGGQTCVPGGSCYRPAKVCSTNTAKTCTTNADCPFNGTCSDFTDKRACFGDGDCTAGEKCVVPAPEDTTIYYTTQWDLAPITDFPKPYFRVDRNEGMRWTCTHQNGVLGDPTRPPKVCKAGCRACGWDEAQQKCVFRRGVQLGIDSEPRLYNDGDPMPLVFGELADDDMCNMFGYFINQADLAKLP